MEGLILELFVSRKSPINQKTMQISAFLIRRFESELTTSKQKVLLFGFVLKSSVRLATTRFTTGRFLKIDFYVKQALNKMFFSK